MAKKKRTRIRQTPTDFQKVFAQHPEMVQSFSWPDRLPEFIHISGALNEHEFQIVKEDFHKISDFVNENLKLERPFHFNLTHTLNLTKELDGLLEQINNSCFKNIFEQILLFYHEIFDINEPTELKPNPPLLLRAYKNILKGRSDVSIISKYLMVQYSHKNKPDPFNLFNFNTKEEILEPQNVSRIMALFPPSIGMSENLDLEKCEEIWMYNYINGTIIPPPDDTELEESTYEVIGMDSLLEELKGLFDKFKGLNLLAIYPTYIAEINMGFVARICNLSIDVVELVKSHKCEIAELTIRTVLESFIVFSWLLKRSDHKLHERFRDFSVGKEKLFSEKLVKQANEKSPFDEKTAKKIASDAIEKSGLNPIEVSTERGDAFDLNVAQMAEEVWGADNQYYFLYKRLSDVTHGSWRVIAKYHLIQSLNPMQNGLYWYSDNENKFAGLIPAFFGITVSVKSMISICNQIDHEFTNELTKELEAFEAKVSTKYLEYYKKYIIPKEE